MDRSIPPKTPKMKAYSYARFSTLEQKRGDSIRRQKKITDHLCQEYNLELVDSIDLEGVSAFKGRNLQVLLEKIDDGQIETPSVLLIEDIDRLSRENAWDVVPYVREILEKGITLLVNSPRLWIDNKTIRSDRTNFLMLQLCVDRAHEESARKQFDLREAWEDKREKIADGIALTSNVPFGFKAIKIKVDGRIRVDKIEIDPMPSKIVIRIFEMATEGISPMAIARTLTEENLSGPKCKTKFHKSFVTKILNHRAYLGEYQPHTISPTDASDKRRKRIREKIGEPIKDYFPQLISNDLWDKAHAAMKAKPGQSQKHKDGTSSILTDLAKCSHCGETITIQNKGEKSSGPKYICTRLMDGRGCKPGRINREAVEIAIVESVLLNLDPDRLIDRSETEPIIKKLESKLSRIEKSIEGHTKELATIKRNLARAEGDTFQIIHDEFRTVQRDLEKSEDDKLTIMADLEQIKKPVSELTDRRNAIEDIAVQAILGIEGATRKTLKIKSYDRTLRKGKERTIKTPYMDWTKPTKISEDEQKHIRLNLKRALKGLIKRINVDMESGTITFTMFNGRKISGWTIHDPRKGINAQIARSLDGMYLKWLAIYGPKTIQKQAQSWLMVDIDNPVEDVE